MRGVFRLCLARTRRGNGENWGKYTLERGERPLASFERRDAGVTPRDFAKGALASCDRRRLKERGISLEILRRLESIPAYAFLY